MDHGKCRLTEVISIPGKMTMSVIKKKTSEYMNKHQLIQELLLHYLLHNGTNKQECEGELEDVRDSHKKPTKLPRYLKKVSFAN